MFQAGRKSADCALEAKIQDIYRQNTGTYTPAIDFSTSITRVQEILAHFSRRGSVRNPVDSGLSCVADSQKRSNWNEQEMPAGHSEKTPVPSSLRCKRFEAEEQPRGDSAQARNKQEKPHLRQRLAAHQQGGSEAAR